MGVTIKVETQGSSGIENKLTAKEIEEADCVIITNDVEIRESQRFKGKKSGQNERFRNYKKNRTR